MYRISFSGIKHIIEHCKKVVGHYYFNPAKCKDNNFQESPYSLIFNLIKT
jgi:hypothetical protein